MNIDLTPNGAIKRVHVSQNDVGRTLTFNLFNDSLAYTVPVGATVKIQGTKPSGFGFSETCTVSGNTVTIDTTEEMTDEHGYIDTELQIKYNGNTIGTSNFVLAVERNPHPDTTTDGSMETIIPELTLLVNEVKGYAEEIEGTYHAYGSPWVASTVAEMTDTDKIYVYTGSETGYVNGNWYYYNGSSWVSGGVYNAVAVQTDTTLSVSGMPADAKVVGDEIDDIKTDFSKDVSEYIPVSSLLIKDKYIETQNGGERDYVGWSATDYILCHGENLLLINTTVATAYNIFYDSTKAKIKGFTISIGENQVTVPDNAYYYRISNTTTAMESMTIKSAIYGKLEDEKEKTNAYESMGNALLSGKGKTTGRTIYVPYTFTSGQKYHITIKNSTASISELRIVSASNLNQDSIVYSYPIGGGYTVEMDYSCNVSNALYVAIIAINGTTGFNADYAIFVDYNPYNYIDRVKESIDYVVGNYPAYYDNYMQSKQNTIKSVSPLHGIQFAFITDLHFPYNAGNSLELLQAIRKNTAVNLIVSGGDFVRAYGGQDDIDMARDRVLDYAKSLYPDWVCLRGNHDFTIRTSAQDTSGITETDAYTYGSIISPMAEWRYDVPTPVVNFYNETYHIGANYCWVVTNDKQKVKIIGFCDMPTTNTDTSFGVNNTITNAYARYFAQLLEDTNGYNVIVATHAPMTAQLQGGYDNNLTTIIEAFANKTVATWGSYNVDFSNNTATLVCCISGHNHTDQSAVVNNVLHINTTCDASYNDDGYNRQVGTVTEQAFDVFTVNFSTRHIYSTRIGAGSDRSFTY